MKSLQHFVGLTAFTVGLTLSVRGAENKVDFAKDIQPIFQKSCLQCHGPEKSKGKLRLDSKAAAFKSDEVLVAGQPEKSDLYRRITLPPGDDDIMPAKGDLLTKVQTDLIREWIKQGAEWPEGLVIKIAEEKTADKDPRQPIKPSPAEEKAIAQLNQLGVQVRPVAMNVTWTTANFRGIDSNNVGKALPLLAQVQTLEDVNLAGLNLKDESLKPLAGLVNLTHLHLEKNPIGDPGLAYLKGLVNLTYLNLYDTQVGDAGVNQLKELKRLKNLYLWQTKVTDDGAKNLQAALPKVDINRGWELTALAKEEEKKTEPKKEEAKAETKPEEKKAEPKKEEPKKEEKKADAAKKDEPAKDQKKDK
jgi:mono/diheme cytochrome c family protein